MNRTLASLCVLSATANAASAQSVVLYGVVDLNLRSIKNGDAGRFNGMGEGTLHASRIGFRGDEDLGDGLRAGFVLEHGLRPYDGTAASANQFWNRRSTVSLMNRFGEIRLGHDNTPAYWNLITFDPFGGGGVASFINLFNGGAFKTPLGSGAKTLSRSDNGIGYFAPENLGGWYGSAQVTAGEGVVGSKHLGGRVGYATGPINVAVAYGTTDIANDKKFDLYAIGGTYDFGVVKVMAQYVNAKTGMVSNFQVDGDQWKTLIGATVPIGVGSISVSYDATKGRNYFNGLRATQLAIGYVHNLSKRTALYAYAAQLKNEGGAGYIVGAVPAVTAASVSAQGVLTPSNMAPRDAAGNFTSKTSSGYEFGIRHRF